MPKLYTVQTLATLFCKHTDTIYRWLEEGLFPHAFKVKDGWYVPERDVQALMGSDEGKPPGPEAQPKVRRPTGRGFIKGWKA